MGKIIVTTGQPFTDIDALACAVSYTELLGLEGKEADAVLPGPLNKTVTDKIKRWKLKFKIIPDKNDANYVLVDISEPEYFANFVKEKDIIEIFDHHTGFENYWKEKIGTKAIIEKVGSCATLIWEEFIKRKKEKNISDTNANLLYTAIISNTLNFKASITTSRDKRAFNEIQKYINLPKNWIEIYFEDQEKESLINPRDAILNDTKGMGFEYKIGQLEFWDSKKFVFNHLKEIEEILSSFGNEKWFFTSPSINEGINYLFTKNSEVKILLEKTISAKFKGDIGTTDKLWLRKEIIQEIKKII